MDEALVNRLLLLFFGSCLAGPALGALWGWWRGFASGMALGCLVIGLSGLVGAGWAAWHVHESLAGTETVQGRLIEFTEERSRDADGEFTVTFAPQVEYTAPDGRARRIKGLGGSQRRVEPGEAVEVRFRRDDPARAVVADFQNVWGVVLALGIFGLFPTLFGLFFVGEARGDRSGAVRREATPAQQRRRTQLTVVANMVFIGGFVVTFLGDDVARSLGAGFMTIGTGALLHFVAQSLPPATAFQPRFIFVIVGLGFVVFGAGAWVLAG